MQVGTLAIQHLFEKDVHYRVPLYQRPYVWNEEDQWQPLWDDLRRISEALLSGRQPRAHFLGASVQDRPTVPPGHIETRLVIDGQQRLTTIQLLLKAFQDVVRGGDDPRYFQALEKLVLNDHPLSTEPQEKFKVWPTNADREDFTAVMSVQDRAALMREFGMRANSRAIGRNVPDAYIFFYDVIKAWLEEEIDVSGDGKIASLYSAIRDNIRLVVIDLDEKDDAQLIFETLNARGTPLLSADLVKNSLLSELLDSGENAETAYQKYWQHFDLDSGFWRAEIGRGHAKRARIETFLQHALTLLTEEDVSAGHLYTAYRDYALRSKAKSALDRLEDFRRYGLIYKELHETQDNPRAELFLERLRVMDVGTAFPFLLKLYDVLSDQGDLLIKVLADVESFLVRRMVCRLSTRGYNRLFVELIGALNVEPSAIPEKVRSALHSGTAEYDRWPDDGEFRQAWSDNPLYENLTRPRMRLLLEAVESGLRSKFAETHEVPRNLTIEHVMPQGWEAHWPLPEDTDAEEAKFNRDRIIHTIGNLTLLNDRLNPVQSNRPWIDDKEPENGKREALREYSVLYLNKQLCDHDKWDEELIGQRASDLFSIATAIWPAPNTAAT